MKIYNRYILSVSFLLLLTTVILMATGQISLGIYFTVYIVEALAITELYVYINVKARQGLSYVSTMLFAGFTVVLCFQIINVLA